MRNIQQFRADQRLNRKFGVIQPVQDWHTTERRQELIEMQLAEYEQRKAEEAERIAKASTKGQIEITSKHRALVNQILAIRDADYRNYVAETNEVMRG